jgi:hypothetical protein
MRFQMLAAACVLAAVPHLSAQSRPADAADPADQKGGQKAVTLRGCVTPGLNDTYVMSGVTQDPALNASVLPDTAHGRKVIFWLKNDADVKKHPNMMVEVSGTVGELKESEAELKAGPHKDGGLVVEFEGPGRDVRASNAQVGAAIGTAGRQSAEANDLKTYLAEVNVTGVKVVGESCK